jgi:hypothetical protein
MKLYELVLLHEIKNTFLDNPHFFCYFLEDHPSSFTPMFQRIESRINEYLVACPDLITWRVKLGLFEGDIPYTIHVKFDKEDIDGN